MSSQILVSLLVSGVFGNEMKIFSADDEGTVHLGGNDSASQDTTTNRDETGEWAFLVCTEEVSNTHLSKYAQPSRSHSLPDQSALTTPPSSKLAYSVRLKKQIIHIPI